MDKDQMQMAEELLFSGEQKPREVLGNILDILGSQKRAGQEMYQLEGDDPFQRPFALSLRSLFQIQAKGQTPAKVVF